PSFDLFITRARGGKAEVMVREAASVHCGIALADVRGARPSRALVSASRRNSLLTFAEPSEKLPRFAVASAVWPMSHRLEAPATMIPPSRSNALSAKRQT